MRRDPSPVADDAPAGPLQPPSPSRPAAASDARGSFARARWLFLKLLGVIYAVAFVSLGYQVRMLYGEEGLLPARELFEGPLAERWRASAWIQPTVFHLSHAEAALVAGTWAGILLAAALAIGIAPGPITLALWGLYLSYVTIDRRFLFFQWDNLLLESGLLAVFLAPWRKFYWLRPTASPPGPALFLFWFLLFRLNFESGASKFLSEDETWRDFTAMDYYYETAPLPTWIGWWVHQLPHAFHAFEVGATYVIEFAAPLLIFGPRLGRLVAAGAILALQGVILLTANYGFFNYLSAALALLLLDDAALARLVSFVRRNPPESAGADDETPGEPARAKSEVSRDGPTRRIARRGARAIAWAAAAAMALAAVAEFGQAFYMPEPERETFPRRAMARLVGSLEPLRPRYLPFRSINRYHLFASMTTTRVEIEIEGSQDGRQWRAYEFRHKPGDPRRAPDFIAPHQPRVDFQCWFLIILPRQFGLRPDPEALRTLVPLRYQPLREPWFAALVEGVLRGRPWVPRLFESDPFAESPPRFVRVSAYLYAMTTPRARRERGLYWRRDPIARWGPFAIDPETTNR